ncbi:MAG: V-type ATP synthase subunit E [Candidatus Aenigmatarchaeota archaeon]|nr:MAG: V-type ATP synthase subunit E [Candidatus Aenigmarchaeota archaeon]
MGMKDIEREIRESGQKEIEQIKKDLSAQLEALRKKIDEKAGSEMRKLEERGRSELELERKRILAKANLRIKEQVEKKKDEIIEHVFEEAGARVIRMTGREKAKIMKFLADEAREGLDRPEVFADGKYATLLKGAKRASIGDFGVKVTSGHISVDNTLSSKLKEIKENSRHKVADALWPG